MLGNEAEEEEGSDDIQSDKRDENGAEEQVRLGS